ncbi:MAG: hypothetical protein ACLT8E_02880 [Akkermansia sp.]
MTSPAELTSSAAANGTWTCRWTFRNQGNSRQNRPQRHQDQQRDAGQETDGPSASLTWTPSCPCILYDFGDMVRTMTSPAAEDEEDLDKTYLRMPI